MVMAAPHGVEMQRTAQRRADIVRCSEERIGPFLDGVVFHGGQFQQCWRGRGLEACGFSASRSRSRACEGIEGGGTMEMSQRRHWWTGTHLYRLRVLVGGIAMTSKTAERGASAPPFDARALADTASTGN